MTIMPNGTPKLLGRLWDETMGPCVVILRDGVLHDVTEKFPTASDALDELDVSDWDDLGGDAKWPVSDVLAKSAPGSGAPGLQAPRLLAPCDLSAIKACGVTFANSMVERVIDERTGGDPERANDLRQRISQKIGGSLADIEAGSQEAARVRKELMEEGLWSQYLEVGIGPDAEIFTKSQPMSAVGYGAEVGIHPASGWNNPEPEVVLAVNASGKIRGAALGNDVNLRDVEGRSALLLGKAKDNNASCAIGPFIRLFDDAFSLPDVAAESVTMTITGTDGYTLSAISNMAEISRPPDSLVRQAMGRNHQYPDGMMLFLGTMFAPTIDRGEPGMGFTHKTGDLVRIESPLLGVLENVVTTSDAAPEWTFGTRALMRSLSRRGLINQPLQRMPI